MTDEETKKRLATIGPLAYLNFGRLLCRLHELPTEEQRGAMWAEISGEERLLHADIIRTDGTKHPVRDVLSSFHMSPEDRELAIRAICVTGHLQVTTPRLPTVSQVAHAVDHLKCLPRFMESRRVILMLCARNVFMVGSSPASPTDHYICLDQLITDYLTGAPTSNGTPQIVPADTPESQTRAGATISSARKLYELVRKRVVGLDPLVKAICSRVIMHRDRATALRAGANPNSTGANQVLLLIGPSGSGKTWLLQAVAEVAGLPFSLFDATTLTEEGYVGLSVSDAVASLVEAAGRDVKAARYGILCLDEWDSRAAKQAGAKDIAGAVQKGVLRLIEGADFPVGGRRGIQDSRMQFDSRGTMFAFAGAYSGLADVLLQQTRKNGGLGFGSGEPLNPESDLYEALISYGCLPEFLNRVSRVLLFPKPTVEQLIAIATSLHGPIAKCNAALASRFTLDFDEVAVRLMAAHAFETERYARGITSLVQNIAEDLVFSGRRGRQVILEDEVQVVIDAMRDGAAGLTT